MSVRAGDLLLRRRLLGAHVVRRAEREARLRHPAAGRRAHRERDAEIRHHRAPVVQQMFSGLMSRWITPCRCA